MRKAAPLEPRTYSLQEMLEAGTRLRRMQRVLRALSSLNEPSGILLRMAFSFLLSSLIVGFTLWVVDPNWFRDLGFCLAYILWGVLSAGGFRWSLDRAYFLAARRRPGELVEVMLASLGAALGGASFVLILTAADASSPFTGRQPWVFAGLNFFITLPLMGGMLLFFRMFSDLARSLEQLQQAYQDTVLAMSRTLEMRDPYTQGHSKRVAEICLILGRAMNLSAAELEILVLAAQFHDVGKIGIPDKVLLKPGPLAEEEWKLIKAHPANSCAILMPLGYFQEALPIVRHHHERFDGRGYPDGLAGTQIPLGARILAVADTLDALASDRPYRPRCAPEACLREVTASAGTQLCSQAVAAFQEAWDKGQIESILTSPKD